jgi:multisubunit Na+/H+ antiporter MnhB subunit
MMTLGLRQLLLLASTIVFFVAIFINNNNWTNWISIGLALLAAAFLVGEMGWDRPVGAGAPHRHE